MQRLILPFLSGLLAVLFFQQAAIGLLHAANMGVRIAYDTAAAPPLGVPGFIQEAVIGGVWGVLMAWALRIPSRLTAPWLGATLFGAIALTAFSIFVIGPLNGVWPSGNILPRVSSGLVSNAAWGWGALVFMRAFLRDVE